MAFFLLVTAIVAFVASPFIGWPLLFIVFALSIAAFYEALKIKKDNIGKAVIVALCGFFAAVMLIYVVQFLLFMTGELYRGGLSG